MTLPISTVQQRRQSYDDRDLSLRFEMQKKQRPSGNRTAFFSRENSSNGRFENPSELSGEILLTLER
jgi:hypothetical protein